MSLMRLLEPHPRLWKSGIFYELIITTSVLLT